MKKIKYIVLGIITILFLSGCADQVNYDLSVYMEPVGFLHGLWHGFISPFALFCSLFNDNVAIYAIYNNGEWYDFGYMLGVGGLANQLTDK